MAGFAKRRSHDRINIKHGFTLIELLVVIAIIAILAAILFPVFASVRAKARDTATISNLKQVSMASLQYTQDFDEMITRYEDNGSPWRSWGIRFQPYLKTPNVCYDAQRTVPYSVVDSTPDWGWHLTLSINRYGYADRPDHLDSPASRIAFAAQGDEQAGKQHYWDMHWFDAQRNACANTGDYKNSGWTEWTYNSLYEGAQAYHRGLLPVAYADGHAKAIKLSSNIAGDAFYGACESKYFPPYVAPPNAKAATLQETWGRWWDSSY